jgi:mevalonate kinase
MILNKTLADASAPAKIILFGEHFVVYGNHAILASINKRINVNLRVNKTRIITIRSNLGITASYADSRFNLIKGGEDTKEILDPIYKCVSNVLSLRKQSFGIEINLHSQVPYGIGLGSSAACCVATVAAVDSLFHKPNRGWICANAVESERLIHKDSSGGDCYISTFGGLIYYIRNGRSKKIKSKKNLNFIIINTGVVHSTKELVSSVKRFKYNERSLFKKLSSCAEDICQNALSAISRGDDKKLGELMNENHMLLQQLGVSNKEIDCMINICIKNGASGAKITGAGGGGSIIALVPNDYKTKIISEIKRNGYESISAKIDYDGLLVH